MALRVWAMAGIVALGAATAAQAQNVNSGSDTVRRAIRVCAACHGENGQSTTAGIPSLAGQSRQYMIEQLSDFRSQTRAEAGTRAYMWGVSALLDDESIAGLAGFYAEQAPAAGKPGNAALMRTGKALFTQGDPARGVRACASCHGEKAEGQAAFPRLAGQRAEYLYAQLKGFGGKLRPHGVLMKAETKAMTPAEMKAVAEYLQSL